MFPFTSPWIIGICPFKTHEITIFHRIFQPTMTLVGIAGSPARTPRPPRLPSVPPRCSQETWLDLVDIGWDKLDDDGGKYHIGKMM